MRSREKPYKSLEEDARAFKTTVRPEGMSKKEAQELERYIDSLGLDLEDTYVVPTPGTEHKHYVEPLGRHPLEYQSAYEIEGGYVPCCCNLRR